MDETDIFLSKLALFEMRKARWRVASVIKSDEWPRIVANFDAIYETLSQTLDKWSISIHSGFLPKEIAKKRQILAKLTPSAQVAMHLTPNFIRGRVRALEILREDAQAIFEKYKKYGGNIPNDALSVEERITIGYILTFLKDIDEFTKDPIKFEMHASSTPLLKKFFVFIAIFVLMLWWLF